MDRATQERWCAALRRKGVAAVQAELDLHPGRPTDALFDMADAPPYPTRAFCEAWCRNGGCAPLDGEDRVCITATNYCSPSPKVATCQRTCPTGQMLVLHDPNNIFDTCDLATETCDCISLPPLVVHDVARHSGLATAGTSLYVSAYDGEYGDLVVSTYDKSSLATPTSQKWVDGVPATGTLGGDPNGPRNGITNPGPNVGENLKTTAENTEAAESAERGI